MGSIVLIVTGTVQIITLLLFTVTLPFRNTGKIQKTFAEITVHITPGIQVFVPQGVCNGCVHRASPSFRKIIGHQIIGKSHPAFYSIVQMECIILRTNVRRKSIRMKRI